MRAALQPSTVRTRRLIMPRPLLLGVLAAATGAAMSGCGSGGSGITFSLGSQIYHANTANPLTSSNGIALIQHEVSTATNGKLLVSPAGAACLARKYSAAGVRTIGDFLDPKTTRMFLPYARKCEGS